MAFDLLNLTTIQASAVRQNATAVGVGFVGGDVTAVNANETRQSA
jgi:hypothetical protein